VRRPGYNPLRADAGALLSGVFFASTNFPDAMQPFIMLLPLTALNDALRAIVNAGLALTAVTTEMAILAAWPGVVRVVAEVVSMAMIVNQIW
jgi:ABC-type polysaccharide/polyol phosphate export permease